MFFGNKAEQFPHLASYLRENEKLDLFRDFNQRWIQIIGVAVLSPIVLGFLSNSIGLNIPRWLIGLASVGIGVFLGLKMMKKRAELHTPEMESRLEAHRLYGTMYKMLQLHRLHRDMSETTLTILDELARTRTEVRQLLDTPFWKQPGLTETYVQLRRQALTASDQAMMDAVMQFKYSVPEKVEARRVADFIDEAVTSFTKQKKGDRLPEPGFETAFSIANRLQEMRSELERITLQQEEEDVFLGAQVPGGLVDRAMSEIRTIRMAEEEIKQGL